MSGPKIPNTTWYIARRDSIHQVMSAGQIAEGARLVLSPYQANSRKQQWKTYYFLDSDTHVFQNVASGMFCGTPYPQNLLGGPFAGPILTSKAHHWQIRRIELYRYTIHGPDCSLALQSTAGLNNNLDFGSYYAPNGGINPVPSIGQWSFVALAYLKQNIVAPPVPRPFSLTPRALPQISNGTYTIRNTWNRTQSNLGAINVTEGTGVFSTFNYTNDSSNNQRFIVKIYNISLTVTIQHVASGLYFSSTSPSDPFPTFNDGKPTVCMRRTVKHWTLNDQNDGTVTINIPGTRWQVYEGGSSLGSKLTIALFAPGGPPPITARSKFRFVYQNARASL